MNLLKTPKTVHPTTTGGRRVLRGDVDGPGRVTGITPELLRERIATLRTTEDKKEATQLKPEKVDFHVDKNRKDHHTDEYAIGSLIVRRGQEFKVSVTFDRPFDDKQDKLVLQLTTGFLPKESKQSLIRIKEDIALSSSSWSMRVDRINGNVVSLTVKSPADAPVGEYSVYVESKTKKTGSEEEYLTFRKKFDENFVVLFNAWCKDDTVYMDNDEHRKEYVLNDHGNIWIGNKRRFTGIPWYFGQFESVSLNTCLYLLETCANMQPTARGNPVLVSRIITQMANYNDRDGGILVGNWSGNYPSSTTAPSSWIGSVGILEEFSRTHDGVCYGQCWVFSGLVTTLLRAIGIPTRSVTNFESAHDTDASMTIDFHFDKNGDPLDYLNDSVWNFHVWNESYFDRPDLPDDNGGWQAIDATPQEFSDGVFCCGPCPIKAIKSGNVYLPYDATFLFGEVNGDRVYWEVDDEGEMKVAVIDRKSIGKFISTKAVGSKDREDLTSNYKYQEGSLTEKQAVRKAHEFSSRKNMDVYKDDTPCDVVFDFLSPDDVMAGSDFDVNLVVKNTSKEQRTIHFTLTTKMAYYTGITAQHLSTLRDYIVLRGNNEKAITLPVPALDYIGKSPADACVKVFFKANVQETQQEFNDIDTIEFKKPTIQALLPDTIMEMEDIQMTLYFINPLPIDLTNCVFKMESSRHLSPDTATVTLNRSIGPSEEAAIVVTLQADQGGKRWVDVSFHSDQLSGVHGEIEFEVTKKMRIEDNSHLLPGYL